MPPKYLVKDIGIAALQSVLNSEPDGYEFVQALDGSGSRVDHCTVIFRMTSARQAELEEEWDRNVKAEIARVERKSQAAATAEKKSKKK